MILFDPEQWDEVVRVIPTEQVFEPGLNRGLFKILLESYRNGETISPAILGERAKAQGILKDVTKKLNYTPSAKK